MTAYRTPITFRSAIESRLRRGATGAGFQRRRLRFVFGRFMARLVAHFGDNILVKGGLALELRLARARSTKDIDLVVLGPGDQLLERLRAAARLELEDFLSFEVAPDGEITGEGVIYGGQHFRIHCRLGGKTYLHFPIDVVLGTAMLGAPDRVPCHDDFAAVGLAAASVGLLPVATHIAEKLHAYTLPRITTNFRVRDLPDLALLATVDERLRMTTLRKAIALTFQARKTHAVPPALPAPPDSWETEYAALAAEHDLPWTTLAEVFARARAFLDPVLADRGDATWGQETWSWTAEELAASQLPAVGAA